MVTSEKIGDGLETAALKNCKKLCGKETLTNKKKECKNEIYIVNFLAGISQKPVKERELKPPVKCGAVFSL